MDGALFLVVMGEKCRLSRPVESSHSGVHDGDGSEREADDPPETDVH